MTILSILTAAEVTIYALSLEFMIMLLVIIIIAKFTKLAIKISFLHTAYKIGTAIRISIVPYFIIMFSHMIIGICLGAQLKDIGIAVLPLFAIFGLLETYCAFIAFMDKHIIDIMDRLEEQEKIHLQSVESIAEDKRARMYFYDLVTNEMKKMKNLDEYNRHLVTTDRFIINHKTKEIIGLGTDCRLKT